MPKAHLRNTDASVHSAGARLRGVKAGRVDAGPWIASFPVCSTLNRYQIAHVGLMMGSVPCEIVRSWQTSSCFLACYGGRGRLFVEGGWRDWRPGMACLLPAKSVNGLRTLPRGPWEFCWVCYGETSGPGLISDAVAAVIGRYDHVPLQSAILGLMHECRNGAAPAFVERWVELIHEYVLRFATPATEDRRLLRLWDRVATELDGDWTLARLAREAGYSSEHLRRLCHLEIGRSPMHQVSYLRMRRAAELLATTKEKIGTIAQEVGYNDPFVFSRAFHRWVGWRPSAYRGNRRSGVDPAVGKPRFPGQGHWARCVLVTIALMALSLGALGFERRPSTEPAPSGSAGVPDGERQRPGIESAHQDRALRDEQLAAARQLYAEFPASLDAAYVAGYVSNEQGDSAAAIRYWEEAARLEPGRGALFDRADACYSLGYAWLLREDFEKAIPMLRESVRLNPGRPEAHYRLAHALFLQGSLQECLRVLGDGKVETPLAHRLRGQANQQLGNFEAARQNYETAVHLSPNLAEAYYGLAATYARLGESAKAEEARRAFDSMKSQGQAMGRQARTDFNPLAITRRSLAQTHTEIARVYLVSGQPQKAERLLLRAAETDPENTACRFQLLMLYQQAQKNQEALRLVQEMIKAEPRNPFHHLAAGNLHLRLRQAAEAEAAFKRVVELGPSRAEGYFALAQMYVQARTNRAEALRLASRAVSLAPSAVNHYVLSQACVMNGNWPAATAAIEKACALDPRNAQYQEWRARLRNERHE